MTRGLSATALVRDGDVFLFDCGEGTQLQLMRSTVKRSRIHTILIGHVHGGGPPGIAGLLSTLHLDGRETPLNVFGPEGLRVFLTAAFRSSDFQFSFKVTLKEFPRGFRGRSSTKKDFYVEALPLDHSIFCLGWRFQEKDKPGVFNLERARNNWAFRAAPFTGNCSTAKASRFRTAASLAPDMVVGRDRHTRASPWHIVWIRSFRTIDSGWPKITPLKSMKPLSDPTPSIWLANESIPRCKMPLVLRRKPGLKSLSLLTSVPSHPATGDRRSAIVPARCSNKSRSRGGTYWKWKSNLPPPPPPQRHKVSSCLCGSSLVSPD